MAQQNIEAKLKKLLKEEKIQLWNPPYTENNDPGQQHMQDLAKRYAPMVCLSASEVGGTLEAIRAQAVKRGKGNKTFRETSVATLELLLPRDEQRNTKKKQYMETKLDVVTQDLMDRIGQEFGLKSIKLILNGKTLDATQRLDQQGVTNNSKMMVLRVNEDERKRQVSQEEERRNNNESLQRTEKGFQILSERDGSEDPETTPFLEIADQKGNPLQIPPAEKKALIVAMGFHEKGRSLMKRKQYNNALCHLLQADNHFGRCGSALLATVDNYAVLQLDIVWCYQALEALSCLDDSRTRLHKAEECFLTCYGQQQQRLLMIKGSTGREEVLYLRLYLLQSLLFYIDGNDTQAQDKLQQVELLYSRLCLDSEKMAQLITVGFSEREARLGLRACQGNVEMAATHIANQRQVSNALPVDGANRGTSYVRAVVGAFYWHKKERQELRDREREKRSQRVEAISVLTEMGFSRRDAGRALHQANGDTDRAYAILVDANQAAMATNNNTEDVVNQEKLEQLLYLGFDRSVSETALRLTDGDVQSATQLLLDNAGVLSPDLLSSSPPSLSSEEPSTSSDTTEDTELVSEVLEDISRHEEDYLDLSLEEEGVLITTIKTYLSHRHLV